jgi:hypothetical protein
VAFIKSFAILIRKRWAGHERGDEKCVWDIGGKVIRKETTRKTNCRWVDNNKMGLIEIG